MNTIFIGHNTETASEVLSAGLLEVNPDTKTISVHDGKTAGGIALTTKGDTGPAGKDGAQGPQGLKGDKGDTGANGTNGTGIGNTVVQNTITLGATTTAPVTGTRTVQRIESQTVGDKLRLTYKLGYAGGQAGSGHYLLSLPTGVSFNTTYNPTYNGANAWTGDTHGQAVNLIPAVGGIVIPGGWTNTVYVVPYDATRFRLLVTYNGDQAKFDYWSNTYYWAQSNTSVNLQFEIWPIVATPPRVGSAPNPTV